MKYFWNQGFGGKFIVIGVIVNILLLWILGIVTFIQIMDGHDYFDLIFVFAAWAITKGIVKWLWGKFTTRLNQLPLTTGDEKEQL